MIMVQNELIGNCETNLETTAADFIADLGGGLPPNVVNAALRTLVGLLDAGLDIPKSYFESIAQNIRNNTNAQTIMSEQLARNAAIIASTNPEIINAAIQAHIPNKVKRFINKAKIAKIAIDEIRYNSNTDNAAPPEEGWLNVFSRYAEDASSNELQIVYGKILAGEISKPHSISKKTLRLTSELTQESASDFEYLWSKNLSEEVLKTIDMRRGEGWNRLERLAEAGLIHSIETAVHQPKGSHPTKDGLLPWQVGSIPNLIIMMKRENNSSFPIVNFTKSGLELGSILPKPDYCKNLTELADFLPKEEVAFILLQNCDDAPSSVVIWPK